MFVVQLVGVKKERSATALFGPRLALGSSVTKCDVPQKWLDWCHRQLKENATRRRTMNQLQNVFRRQGGSGIIRRKGRGAKWAS